MAEGPPKGRLSSQTSLTDRMTEDKGTDNSCAETGCDSRREADTKVDSKWFSLIDSALPWSAIHPVFVASERPASAAPITIRPLPNPSSLLSLPLLLTWWSIRKIPVISPSSFQNCHIPSRIQIYSSRSFPMYLSELLITHAFVIRRSQRLL